ncbi:FAD-dependent oxidoreductase [Candidatus Woesebacteria bacterium]|nr:FAD-dependent oxidoreductase [Candidatus Woesebacteria bacterium]
MKHKIAIIGSGPAGLAAAIYTSRADIETTIYAGLEPGGQLTKTTEIENYPGVMGKTGPELMVEMTQQAQKFGSQVVYETVEDLNKIRAEYDAVILAMGASPRLMGVGEERYWGKGFSTCAVCDAAFYRGKNVYVVGGGDSAIEDAWALTKFASSVTILVRKAEFRASKAMQKRITDNPDKIKVMWKTSLKEIRGERVEELVLDVDGVEQVVKADGLFFAIGHIPATGFLKDSDVAMDEEGYILTQAAQGLRGDSLKVEWPTMTSVTGVFAAGDCVDHRYRQAATAVGMGVQAALDCERWLESK